MTKLLISIRLVQFAMVIFLLAVDFTVVRVEGSCDDRCHSNYNLTDKCHCDHSCIKYKNCCDDYLDICLPEKHNSCFGRCSGYHDYVNISCSCHVGCVRKGNCCEDFLSTCSGHTSCEWLCSAPLNNSVQCDCDTNCSYSCCKNIINSCRAVYGPSLPNYSGPMCPDKTSTEVCPTVAATISADVATTPGGSASMVKFFNYLLICLCLFVTTKLMVAF